MRAERCPAARWNMHIRFSVNPHLCEDLVKISAILPLLIGSLLSLGPPAPAQELANAIFLEPEGKIDPRGAEIQESVPLYRRAADPALPTSTWRPAATTRPWGFASAASTGLAHERRGPQVRFERFEMDAVSLGECRG